jgi:hypothetical protein
MFKGITSSIQIVFSTMGVLDNESNTKLQFHLDTFNSCCTQIHKVKYSMNVQYPFSNILELIWATYHIFETWKGIT